MSEIAQDFIEGTVNIEFNEVHQRLLRCIPAGGKVLDLGCGSGRDSKAFIAQGYQVVAVDGSVEMCKAASELIGQEVVCIRFEELQYVEEFDGIWASASLLHVAFGELENVIGKVKRALKVGGAAYMSFKYGDYEGERNGRYFTDMNEERMGQVFEGVGGLEVIEMTVGTDVRAGREGERWLNVVVRKVGK